jgi:hypothetical protein
MSLILTRSVVNHELHLTLPFEDRAGPGEEGGCHNPSQIHPAKTALVYPDDIKALTVSVIGQALELAGTRMITITTTVLNSFHVPLNHRLLSSFASVEVRVLQYRAHLCFIHM